jgi:hypothetical protein
MNCKHLNHGFFPNLKLLSSRMALNSVREFQVLAYRSCQLRLHRHVSTFDSRCRTSKLLQPLNLIPHGETAHKSPKKFEDISSKSSRLLVDLGFIRPASPGTFVYLNLALRAMEKLTSLADVVMEQAGCQKILLPSLVFVQYFIVFSAPRMSERYYDGPPNGNQLNFFWPRMLPIEKSAVYTDVWPVL